MRIFHVVGYQATTFNHAALGNYLTPTPDTLLTITGTNVRVPYLLNNVLAAYADSQHLTQARIETPTLVKDSVYPNIEPMDNATAVTSGTIPFNYWGPRDGASGSIDFSIPLTPGENMQVNASTSGSDTVSAVVFLSQRAGDSAWSIPGTTNDVRTMQIASSDNGWNGIRYLNARATSSTTLTARAWSTCVLTFDQALPPGAYAMVGMRATSATVIAARAVIKGAPYRPGVIGSVTTVGLDAGDALSPFRAGRLGVWGTFENTTPPDVEYLATGADTSEVVNFDLIKFA